MKKAVTVKFEEEELRNLDERAEMANMNRSDYIRYMIAGDIVQVIDKSREFYQSLHNILDEINKVESTHKLDYSAIREEVLKACHILNV
ncbi:MAG: ribbon-helix-helix domain-containing protein [Clostridiales bacterium]|nr:ribbon-helix-helix domain-containing protein [Clostridiales bacterium]